LVVAEQLLEFLGLVVQAPGRAGSSIRGTTSSLM
jgi:hypothetical protein